MPRGQTPYAETEILLAVMEERYADAEELLNTQLNRGELSTFRWQLENTLNAVNLLLENDEPEEGEDGADDA